MTCDHTVYAMLLAWCWENPAQFPLLSVPDSP